MKFEIPQCPECNGDAVGIIEVIKGLAGLHKETSNTYEYDGGTDVWWDDQKPVPHSGGRVSLMCWDEHEWLTKRTDSVAEEDPNEAKYREAATKLVLGSPSLGMDIDADAVVSMGEDPGAYVQVWLWVSKDDAGIEEES